MEYLGGGSALDLMKAGSFTENDIAIIIREILHGLHYLHSERKLHRDIKGKIETSSFHGGVGVLVFGRRRGRGLLVFGKEKGCVGWNLIR